MIRAWRDQFDNPSLEHSVGGREGGREGGRKGGRERGREGGREEERKEEGEGETESKEGKEKRERKEKKKVKYMYITTCDDTNLVLAFLLYSKFPSKSLRSISLRLMLGEL